MQDQPRADELLDAVQEFLMKEVLPAFRENEALAYKTLVSWNTLGILAREFKKEDELVGQELQEIQTLAGLRDAGNTPNTQRSNRERLADLQKSLVERIRTEGLREPGSPEWEYVQQSTAHRLAVVNPRFEL